jgi:hypothetical protein
MAEAIIVTSSDCTEEPDYNRIWSGTFAWKCDLGILSRKVNVTRSEDLTERNSYVEEPLIRCIYVAREVLSTLN